MRIDILLRSRNAFNYEIYAAKRLSGMLERRGIPFKQIVFSDCILLPYLQFLEKDPPRSIVSFDPILPYQTPFCDFVGVPQLLWVKNSLCEAAHFLTSKYGIVGLPTPTDLDKTVYLPHGIEAIPRQEDQFDVVFFSPLVDTECLRERWKEFFSDEVIELLDTAVSSGRPAYETLKEAPCPLSLCHSIEAVEEYTKAVRAYKTISSCKGHTLDVFGEHIGNNWYRRLPNALHLRLHAPLPYTAHFDVLAQSKLVILDPLDRSWELPAAAAGCLPLMADLEDLHEQIALYLADSKKREKALERYREPIELQTWDNQAGRLIEIMHEN
ncbi:MAG: hypothetical protein JJU12_06425 [Chlamydiales bacterium]|nr:hypothetical protein [Chlamydiales bacterium]